MCIYLPLGSGALFGSIFKEVGVITKRICFSGFNRFRNMICEYDVILGVDWLAMV